MNRFKVLAGVHLENGREYKMGEVVESNLSLSAMYLNKFQDLGPASPSSPVSSAKEPERSFVEEAPVAEEDDGGWGEDEEEQKPAPLPKVLKKIGRRARNRE